VKTNEHMKNYSEEFCTFIQRMLVGHQMQA